MKGGIIVIIVIVALVVIGFIGYSKFKASKAIDLETLRQQKVADELKLTYIVPVETDVVTELKSNPDVTEEELILYRHGIIKLLEVAPIMHLLYQKQLGTHPDDRIKAETDNDRELFDRYGHPWCCSDTSDECCAIPTLPKRTSGVIPDGVTCDKAKEIGSPFEAIVKGDGGELKAVPYAKVWPEDLSEAAKLLRESTAIFEKIPREKEFAGYLNSSADAFESKEPFPFHESDESWNRMLASSTLLFARIGPDEVGTQGAGDLCECKAKYHFIFGIVSGGAEEIVARLQSAAERFEGDFAQMIDNPKGYVERSVNVQLPVFLDVVLANGNSIGGPGGTPIGQTLPNWCGKDGKGECQRGTMIYVNKSQKAYSNEAMKKYIMPLFAHDVQKYFDVNSSLDSIVYHEMFHNFGPMYGIKMPGSDKTYGGALVTEAGKSWKGAMEEMKAQTGSLYMANQYYLDARKEHAAGKMSGEDFSEAEDDYRKHIVYDMAWAMRMILRASRSGPEFKSRSSYSRLAAVQVGFLADQGALIYNEGSKEWSIDWSKIPAAINTLMKKTGDLYTQGNPQAVEDFFIYYMTGDGEKGLHRDRIVEIAGKMPSTIFDYRVKGL